MTPEERAGFRAYARKMVSDPYDWIRVDRAEVLALLDALDAAEARIAVVDKFVAERNACITAIENCPPDRADYWRWQGHAEARRVLAEDIARIGASTDPADIVAALAGKRKPS